MRMRQEKEKEKEMAKKAQLAEARLIAENRFLIYAMKALRLSFNAWQESVAMTRLRTHQHQVRLTTDVACRIVMFSVTL